MYRRGKKILYAFLFIILVIILYVWHVMTRSYLYVENGGKDALCFYLDDEFKSIVPPATMVHLKIRGGSSRKFSVSRFIDGPSIEEFHTGVAGKHLIYNVLGQVDHAKEIKNKDNPILIIRDKPPKDYIEKINQDILHRMIMDSISEDRADLKKIEPVEAILYAGTIRDKSSEEWLLAILKLNKRRSDWPAAIVSLAMIGENKYMDLISRYLYYEDIDVRIASIDALSIINSSSSTRKLIDLYRGREDSDLEKYILEKLRNMVFTVELKNLVIREIKTVNNPLLEHLVEIIRMRKIREALPYLEKILKSDLKQKDAGKVKSKIKETIGIIKGS